MGYMTALIEKKQRERELPSNVDFYIIDENGGVSESCAVTADAYIDEFDVCYFTNKEVMLFVRRKFGPVIGVMRDISCSVESKESRTPKVLLGVARS